MGLNSTLSGRTRSGASLSAGPQLEQDSELEELGGEEDKDSRRERLSDEREVMSE